MEDPIYLDNHLIAVYKPYGVLTESDRPGGDSMIDRTKEWLKSRFDRPGNIFLGLVHRLDRPVAGVILFARTSKAASRLSKQFREKTVVKIYRGAVLGIPKKNEDRLTGWLRKNPKSGKTTVFSRKTEGAQKAELNYRVIETFREQAILEIVLHTGRFHQIRAQLAFMKHPMVGDVKYGAPRVLPNRHIALYAKRLEVEHPISGDLIALESPQPKGWPFTN
tara:strand:+ start:5440 stop:6102 length:663 start_codon:yes stop_codon:yes gene_type:complete